MMESKASAVTLRNTPKSTVGVVFPKIKNPRVVWPNIKNATLSLRIKVVRAKALQGICSLVLW